MGAISVTHAPARYCPVQTCTVRTPGGRPCRDHARVIEHGRPNYQWRRLYRQARWKATRRAVLSEEPFCGDCIARDETYTATTEVHHRQRPQSEGAFFDRENLMALCHDCHSVRTGRGE